MDNVCINLKGKYVKLIPYDEQYLEYMYVNIINDNIEGFEECNIKQKNDLYKFINTSNTSIKVFIKDISINKVIGYIAGYKYNKVDGYIYITAILEKQKKLNEEALKLFIEYIFICFPIRKIYCEIYGNHNNKLDVFQTIGFNEEAILDEDVFFDGKYYNRYILALYREDYHDE